MSLQFLGITSSGEEENFAVGAVEPGDKRYRSYILPFDIYSANIPTQSFPVHCVLKEATNVGLKTRSGAEYVKATRRPVPQPI
jgi:hypothetical protein